MQFRTPVSITPAAEKISHSDRLLMLGSCFTDEVGARLMADGFQVTANPCGPIYNPVILSRVLARALGEDKFTSNDLVPGPRGQHCLTFASRYSGHDSDNVLEDLNSDFQNIIDSLKTPSTIILTLGSAYVFTHVAAGEIVGNCHKLAAREFSRRLLSVDEIVAELKPVVNQLSVSGHRVIFTVSPIRHPADGLHGNTISKSTLHLAINALTGVEYFPAYEALIDDLRDYRFYAADMKHPSDVAVDYIYELFAATYFSPATNDQALKARAQYKHNNHRPIL